MTIELRRMSSALSSVLGQTGNSCSRVPSRPSSDVQAPLRGARDQYSSTATRYSKKLRPAQHIFLILVFQVTIIGAIEEH